MINILVSRFPHLESKGTSEQRPPVSNDHYFWVPRVIVVHRFNYIYPGAGLLEYTSTRISIILSEISDVIKLIQINNSVITNSRGPVKCVRYNREGSTVYLLHIKTSKTKKKMIWIEILGSLVKNASEFLPFSF